MPGLQNAQVVDIERHARRLAGHLLRKRESTLLQPLVHDRETTTRPQQQLHLRLPPVEKHKDLPVAGRCVATHFRRLELGDIRWRTGELQIRRTKCRRERVVPLLEEAGRALATYILSGRPPCSRPTVFVCHAPPVRPIPLASTVAAIVRRRLACCLRPAPQRGGAHLFRHSIATRLVQQERPIKEVADLLGHQSIDASAI
jgi:Site-specific recombinase XerD